MIETLGVNPNAFAVALGYKRSQTIYDIVNGKSAPSFDFFHKLASSEYASVINIHWVLTGEGPVLSASSGVAYPMADERLNADVADVGDRGPAAAKCGIDSVPLYEPGAPAARDPLFEGSEVAPVCYVRLPGLAEFDGAMTMRGDSMSPVFREGDILLYRWEDDPAGRIAWGKPYLLSLRIDGGEFVAIQFLEPADDPLRVRLVSANRRFEALEVPREAIGALARIKGSLRYDPLV